MSIILNKDTKKADDMFDRKYRGINRAFNKREESEDRIQAKRGIYKSAKEAMSFDLSRFTNKNEVKIDNKSSIKKTSGLITDNDHIEDTSFTVEKASITQSGIAQLQTKNLLGGMSEMHKASVKMTSKLMGQQIAINQNMLGALNKANEFRYTVQADYYKASLEYKKSIISELQSINSTLRIGFHINSKNQVDTEKQYESMARLIFGGDWKKGVKKGLLKSFNSLTGGAGGLLEMVKSLTTGTIEQLLRDGGLFKNILQKAGGSALGFMVGENKAKSAMNFFNDPAKFFEAMFDKFQMSQNKLLKALGVGFGSGREGFGTYDAAESYRNNNMRDRAIFDKAAHTAITKIIPYYLANIQSALKKQKAIYFDYSRNQFMTQKESEALFKESSVDEKKYLKEIEDKASSLINAMSSSAKAGSMKDTLNKLPKNTREEITLICANLIKMHTLSGKKMDSDTARIIISKDFIMTYAPELIPKKSDDNKTKVAKENKLFIIEQIFKIAGDNFFDEYQDLVEQSDAYKNAIESDIKRKADIIENNGGTFNFLSGAYITDRTRGADIHDLSDKHKKQIEKLNSDYSKTKEALQGEMTDLVNKVDIRLEHIREMANEAYQMQTGRISHNLMENAIKQCKLTIQDLEDNGHDELSPKLAGAKGTLKTLEAMKARMKDRADDIEDLTDEKLREYAGRGFKTNRFGGARMPASVDEIKENAKLFLDSDAGDKVSKTAQFGMVAGLSALIAKKGGMGKIGAPIAGAMVASAIHIHGGLNKMVRVVATDEGDETMDDGRTRRQALMQNLIKDLLPAGFAVATGVKVSNFVKNSVNFGGILGPVIGFGVGSAVFALSKSRMVGKLVKGLFGGLAKMIGFVDRKLFKNLFTDIGGGIKDMFMSSIGKKLGMDKDRASYKDILDQRGKKRKPDDLDKSTTAKKEEEDISGSASRKKIKGTLAGTCAPLVMARLTEYFHKVSVKDDAFDDLAKEYLARNKKGITINFFLETLRNSGAYGLVIRRGATAKEWKNALSKKTVIIGHRKAIKDEENGHFLLYTNGRGDFADEYDPLTEKWNKGVSIGASATICNAVLIVHYKENGEEIKFDIDGSKVSSGSTISTIDSNGVPKRQVTGSRANELRKPGKKSNVMQVEVVGGHIDTLTAVGGIDMDLTNQVSKELSRTADGKLREIAKNNITAQNRIKAAKESKQEQDTQIVREQKNTEALQKLANADKEEEPEKKKGLLEKLKGFFPFLIPLIGGALATLFKRGWKRGLTEMAVKGAVHIGKFFWEKIKGLFSIKKGIKKAGNWLKTLFGRGAKESGEELVEEGAEKLTKEIGEETSESIMKELTEEGSEKAIKELTEEGLEKAGKEGIENVTETTIQKLAPQIDNLAGRVGSIPIIGKLIEKSTGKKFFDFFKKILPKFAKEASEEGAEKVAKKGIASGIKGASSGFIGVGTAVNIGFAIWDVISAVRKTHEIFGISPKEVTPGHRIAAGLVAGTLGALEAIPYASWILLPIRILFEKKMTRAVYKHLFPSKSEKEENDILLNADKDNDGSVSEQERADYQEFVKKRTAVREKNAEIYAKRCMETFDKFGRAALKIPILGKLLKSASDLISIDKMINVIKEKFTEKVKAIFVEMGTQKALIHFKKKRAGSVLKATGVRLFTGVVTTPYQVFKSMQRVHDIFQLEEATHATLGMRVATGYTTYIMETASRLPYISFLVEPVWELYGDEIIRSVYKYVIHPAELVSDEIINVAQGVSDMDGDGDVDQDDVKLMASAAKAKAEEFVKKIQAMIDPILQMGKKLDTWIMRAPGFGRLYKKMKEILKVPLASVNEFLCNAIHDMAKEMFMAKGEAGMNEFTRTDLWKTAKRGGRVALTKFTAATGTGLALATTEGAKAAFMEAQEIFGQGVVIDFSHRIVAFIVTFGLVALEATTGAGPIIMFLREAFREVLCIKVYNAFFSTERTEGMEEEPTYNEDAMMGREDKFKENVKTAPADKDLAERLKMSDDAQNRSKEGMERYRDMVSSIFKGDGNIYSGGFFDKDGKPIAIQLPQQAQASTEASATTGDTSATTTAETASANTGTSDPFAGLPQNERNILKRAWNNGKPDMPELSAEQYASIAKYKKNHPKGYESLLKNLYGKNGDYKPLHNARNDLDAIISSGGKDPAEYRNTKHDQYVKAKTKLVGAESKKVTSNGRTLSGSGSRRGLGGRGSNAGGRIPFYSQDVFMAKHNVGGETGSEAGCALATAKMIISYRKLSINDGMLYNISKNYVLSDNSIETGFFAELGGQAIWNVNGIMATMTIKGNACALLTNKNGYNHYVALINDNGRLLLGDPESTGYYETSFEDPLIAQASVGYVFGQPVSSTMDVASYENAGKGRGRIYSGRGPENNKNMIGFGTKEMKSSMGSNGSSSGSSRGKKEVGRNNVYSGSLYDYTPGTVAVGGAPSGDGSSLPTGGPATDRYKFVRRLQIMGEGGWLKGQGNSGDTMYGIDVKNTDPAAIKKYGLNSSNIKNLSFEDASNIWKEFYYDPGKFEGINNDFVRAITYDTHGGSPANAVKYSIEYAKKYNGNVGNPRFSRFFNDADIEALNKIPADKVNQFLSEYSQFFWIDRQKGKSDWSKFGNGWINRRKKEMDFVNAGGNIPGEFTVNGRTFNQDGPVGGKGSRDKNVDETDPRGFGSHVQKIHRELTKNMGGGSMAFDGEQPQYKKIEPTLKKYYHPDFVKMVKAVFDKFPGKIAVDVNTGLVRTKAKQAELYAQGRTKPGKKVTWTMESRHRVQSDGYCHAIDLVGNNNGPSWSAPYFTESFSKQIAEALKEEGAKYNITMDSGVYWPKQDTPHHQYLLKGQTWATLKATDNENVDHTGESGNGPASTGEANASSSSVSTPGKMTLKGGKLGGWVDKDGKEIDIAGALAKHLDKKYATEVAGYNGVTESNPNGVGSDSTGGSAAGTSGAFPEGAKDRTAGLPVVAPKTLGPNDLPYKAAKFVGANAVTTSKACCKTAVANGYRANGLHMEGTNTNSRSGKWPIVKVNGKMPAEGSFTGGSSLTPHFKELSIKSGVQVGDIATINLGLSSGGGLHVMMYVGKSLGALGDGLKGWVSDFKQEDPFIYRKHPGKRLTCTYRLWRHKDYCGDIKPAKENGPVGVKESNPYGEDRKEEGSINNIFKNNSSGFSVSSKHNTLSNFSSSDSLLQKARISVKGGSGINNSTIGYNNGFANMESLLDSNNKLLQEMIKESRLLNETNKKQLTVQEITAKTNAEIAKKEWSNDIKNIFASKNVQDAAIEFDELKKTMERWKNEKTNIVYKK